MASSVKIGTLQGVLAMQDRFTEQLNKLEVKLKSLEDRQTKTTRTVKSETDKINDAYRKVAASLDPTIARTQKYEKSVEALNAALKAGLITQAQHTSLLNKAQSQLQSTEHWTSRLGRSIGTELTSNFMRFFAVTAVLSTIGAGIVSISKQLVNANLEAEASSRRVEESVRRYGATSGVTVGQIDELAQSISRLTGIDDELVADAETVGLKFNRIGSDIFPRFTKAAVDLSVATGQDLSSAFEKAGKIVNQPLRGLTLLSREGYAVSKSQAEMVKSMVSAGDIMGAQGIMLEILEGQYGGAAEAARDTMAGAIKALQTTWENFLERVGQDNMGPLRQALESIISLLERATDNVYVFELGWHRVWAGIYGDLAVGYESLAKFTDLLSKAALVAGQVSLSKATAKLSKSYADEADAATESTLHHGMALANLLLKGKEGHKGAAGAALEQTEAEAKLGKEINRLSDSIRQSIEEMQRRAANARNLWQAATLGLRAYNAELLRQKIAEAILKEENKLREIGGKLTQVQKNAIAEAITAEDLFNRKLKETLALNEKLVSTLLTATDNIAGKGFAADFKRFIDDAHRGMELIQIDVEEMLGGLAKIKDLDLEVEFNSRLMDVEPHLRGIEANYLSFLESIGSGFERAGENAITAGERILQTLAERFGITIDEIRAHLQALNDASAIEGLQLGGRSTLEIYRDEREEINRLIESAARQGIDITEGGQRAINDLQSSFWSENLSNWASALGFLADQFGGFFSYLARAVQSLQQAQGFGNSISGMASGMGASAGTSSALGAMGGTVAIFALIYSWGKELLAASKSRNYGSGTDFSLHNFQESTSQIDAGARETVKAIRGLIKSVEDALRISISDLGEIGIKIRNDGEKFKAYFKGELIGKFNSFEEAMGEALRLAFSDPSTIIHGLSDLMKQGLREFTIPDFEELTDFLADLREISDLDLSNGALQIIESIRHLDDLWLTLGKMREITPEVTRGFENLIAAELRSWQAWADSITGREKSNEELLAEKKQEAVIFEAQKAYRIAELEMKKLGLQADLEWLKGKGGILQADGRLKQGELEMGKSFVMAKAEIAKAELSLNEQWILALQAQIEAINVLIQSLLDIPTIDVGKIKIPRGPKGGGQGDSLRDWVSDKRFELDTRGMDEYRRSVLEKEREYQDKLAEVGKKDKGLRAEIIALRERELELMAQDRMRAVESDYSGFIEQSNAFTEVRNTASALIDSINDSPFGDTPRAEMVANVLGELNERLQDLSDQAVSGLFSSLISDLEQFGVEESQLAGIRKAQAILEHELKLAHYRTEIEIIRAQGKASAAHLAILGEALDILEKIDPSKFDFGGGNGDFYEPPTRYLNQEVEKTVDDLERLREAFRDAKDKILDEVLAFDRGELGSVTPEAGWEEARRQFESIIKSAQAGNLEAFEDAPEVFRNTLDILKEFSPALFATLAPELRNKLRGLADLSKVKDGNLILTDFEKRAQHKETVDTLSRGFGDLSARANEQSDIQSGMLAELQNITIAQREINTRLDNIESGRWASNK